MSRASAGLWAGWTAALDAGGPVELTAGDRLVVRMDAEGVLLPEVDLLVPWVHLGSTVVLKAGMALAGCTVDEERGGLRG